MGTEEETTCSSRGIRLNQLQLQLEMQWTQQHPKRALNICTVPNIDRERQTFRGYLRFEVKTSMGNQNIHRHIDRSAVTK